MFAIKTNIPVPGKRSGRPRKATYPFVDLSVGQCFFVPIGDEPEKRILNRIRMSSREWRKSSGLYSTQFRIASHIDPDSQQPAVGVWRTR